MQQGNYVLAKSDSNTLDPFWCGHIHHGFVQQVSKYYAYKANAIKEYNRLKNNKVYGE